MDSWEGTKYKMLTAKSFGEMYVSERWGITNDSI
jgi:hypothetical protein